MPRAKTKGKARKEDSFWKLLKGNKYTLVLGAVVLLGALLIGLFYAGPYLRFDDTVYLTLTSLIGTHAFSPVLTPRAFGWLFIYLSYLGQSVFGMAGSGAIALSALEYLSLISLTYLLAIKVSEDRKLALLSAFLVCIFPFTIQYATRLLPDMLLGIVATLSIVFLFSERKLDWILAGAMAGSLIYIKLMGIAFLIPFVICALATRKRNYAVPVLLLMLAVYVVPFIAYTHNPLYSFQNYGSFQESLSPTTPFNNMAELMLMGSLFQEYQMTSINFQNYQLGLLLWLMALGTALSVMYLDKKMLAMAWIFWVYLLYLCFGPITLSGYVVGSFITRYLIVVAAPMAILVAYAIKNIAVKFPIRGRGGWVHIAIFLLIMMGIVITLWHTYHLVYYYNEMIRNNPFWVPPAS